MTANVKDEHYISEKVQKGNAAEMTAQ